MLHCVYHRVDNDGKSSAAIVKKKYPECNLLGTNYGDEFPWKEIKRNDTVIMVDFSLPVEKMKHLDSKTTLIWIDHHVSAIEDAQKANFNPNGLREIGKSGCELTWEYFFKGESIPTIIHHFGRFDVWDHTDPLTLLIQYGSAIEDTSPKNQEFWQKVFANDQQLLDKLLFQGEIIQRYQIEKDAGFARACAFSIMFEGFRTLVLNTGSGSSLAFSSIWDPDKYDVMLTFVYNPNGISLSIYSDKPNVDVSKIAKKLGGGGHANASGAIIENVKLPKEFGGSPTTAIEGLTISDLPSVLKNESLWFVEIPFK